MAACSSGSTADWSTSASWSGCRKPAFSSSVTLASSSSTRPSPILASGLTSTSVASSATNACHSFTAMSTTWSATSAGNCAAATISRALASSTPLLASIAILATLSGVLLGDLLDLHAAGHAGDAEEGAVGPVEQVGEVVLLGDVRRLGEHHLVDGVALDVHAEDVGRRGPRASSASVGQLDAAGLAPAADLDLGLDDDPAAEALGDRAGLLRGRRRRRRPARAGRAVRTGRAPDTRTGPRVSFRSRRPHVCVPTGVAARRPAPPA